MSEEHLNTEGVVLVGELTSRTLREAQAAEDYHNAGVSGQVLALSSTASWVADRIAAAGPYDDVRALGDLLVWIGDKIREVQAAPTKVSP